MNDAAKPLPKLTRKQKAFVGELVANPTMSGREAARRAYNVKNDNTAGAVASRALTYANVLAHLENASVKAEMAVVSVMDTSLRMRKMPAHGALALSAANSLLDRVHGKATQRIESTSTTVSISIDLSGDDVDKSA